MPSAVTRPIVPHRPARSGQAPGFVDLPGETGRLEQLSVVLTVREAGDILAAVLADATAALGDVCDRWDLFVADHGPGDHGPAVVDGWSSHVPAIGGAWLGSQTTRGEAARVGLEHAAHRPVLLADGCAGISPGEVSRLAPHLGRVDLVFARPAGPPRRTVDEVLRRLATGLRVPDPEPLFVLLGARAIERVELPTADGEFGVALALAAARAGLSWCEVDVPVRTSAPARRSWTRVPRWLGLRRG